MTFNLPYPLAQFANLLRIESIVFDLQRNDEISGSGDGRIWQAELAPPLWTAEVTFAHMSNDKAKQIAALVRKLNGSQESFFLCDPISRFPQYDSDGSKLGSAVVRINSIITARNAFSLGGLPAGYRMTLGDKMAITFGSNPTRYAFLEVSETVVANAQGVTPSFQIYPHLPTGIAVNAVVDLTNPSLKCIMMPGSFKPGAATVDGTSGGGFKAIQKK